MRAGAALASALALALAPGAGSGSALAGSPASALGERSFERNACNSSSAAAFSAEAACSRLSTERRRSGDMDAHDDVGVDGDALDGDALDGDTFGAFDALDAPDGDGLEGDGLERDACPCGEEGRATTIEVPTISLTRSAHFERRT